MLQEDAKEIHLSPEFTVEGWLHEGQSAKAVLLYCSRLFAPSKNSAKNRLFKTLAK